MTEKKKVRSKHLKIVPSKPESSKDYMGDHFFEIGQSDSYHQIRQRPYRKFYLIKQDEKLQSGITGEAKACKKNISKMKRILKLIRGKK